MFREQLHTAFDNISPSPELLDRVSAMMKEEVNKKKAPLRLNVVKYGGIAAALMLAAGGTFLVINNQNGGVKTSDSAAVENYAQMKNASVQGDSVNEYALGADEASEEKAVEEIAEEEHMFIMSVTQENSMNSEAPTENDSAGKDDAAETAAAEGVAAETAAEENYESYSADDSKDNDAEPVSQDEKTEKRADENSAERADEAGQETVGGTDNGESPTAVQDTVTESAVDPATGISGTDPFLDIRTWSLSIPAQLEDLVDGVRTVGADSEVIYGDKWREYVHAVMKTGGATTIDSELNIYTFIKYFDIPFEDARKALYDAADTKTGVPDITLTRGEADIILTMDIEKITAAFANPYAIVKGTDIYTPAWLLEHSSDDYRAAGITQDDIRRKYGALSTMADTFNDAVIDKETQAKLNAKLDEFLQ